MRAKSLLMVWLSLVLATAACSTSKGSQGKRGGAAGSVTAGGPVGGSAVVGAATTSTVVGSGSGGAQRVAAANGTASGATVSGGGGLAPGVVATGATCGTGQLGQGVTAKTITLGFEYSSDVGTANASLGGNTWSSDEPKSDGEAFIKYFNSTGGLCGRQIVPVWADEKVVSGNTSDQEDQAACTTFTQDNKVFAAMDLNNFRPARVDCLAKAGVLAVDTGSLLLTDSAEARKYFNVLLQPYTITVDRFSPVFVDQLIASGYFTKGAKVGLIYTDDPNEGRGVQRSLVPYLKAKGITLTDQAVVTHTYNIDSLASSESQTNSAVLRFQSEGITEVLAPFDQFSLTTFGQRATQQKYFPRFAMSTSDQNGIRGGMGQSVDWNPGALDVVWEPALSWAEAQTQPGTRTCLTILAKEGHRPPHDQAELTLPYCDFLMFLRAALARAHDLTSVAVVAAAEGVGPQVDVGRTWKWQVTATRHDGVGAVRVARYSGGADGQWSYVTPLTPIA
ncbi:MAG: ABC transporter substrate-binding protein [Acidimicrobiales bacterium]